MRILLQEREYPVGLCWLFVLLLLVCADFLVLIPYLYFAASEPKNNG